MSAVELLFAVLIRAFILALPIGVAILAFRRLEISTTSNMWVYALICGFSAFTAAGLLPWALAFQPPQTAFLLSAVLSPPLWMAVVVVLGVGRRDRYEPAPGAPLEAEEPPMPRIKPTLVLTDPVAPPAPVPLFRHHRPAKPKPADTPLAFAEHKSLLSVARDMRGLKTSEERRSRRLLPPPGALGDLPFVR